MTEKLYADRDNIDSDYYHDLVYKHIKAMTAEDLHNKAAIAMELAYRDWLLQQKALDDDTRKMVLELCNAVYEHIAVWKYPYGKLTLELAKQIREKLEAGE